jgi:glycosyltransferase involved in cell wall biosynthesis
MKLTVLCSDIPFPPNHGGRIDVWNRLKALKKNGVSLQFVMEWLPNEKPTEDLLNHIRGVADDIISIPRYRSVKDYLRTSYPPRMYSFLPKREKLFEVLEQIRSFSPDWLWLDGWHCYLLAQALKKELHTPIAYRSQNVEHEYFDFQAESATGIKKLALGINARRLRHAEVELRREADVVFDITEEDAQSWGVPLNSGKWHILPPLYIFPEKELAAEPIFDIAYIGNLWTPNNREGLMWFICEVLPIIRSSRRNTVRIVFAGASPHPTIMDACLSNGIECVASPESVTEYYAASKVLINPVLKASGINIKMLDMLASGKPIVSTQAAVRGIPKDLLRYINVALSPEEFAQQCIRNIDNQISEELKEMKMQLDFFFGVQQVKRIVGVLLLAQKNNIASPKTELIKHG